MRRSIWIVFFLALLSACGNPTAFFKTDSSYRPRPSISFSKSSVINNGKEWLQPSQFTKLSVSKVANICKTGMVCSGTLNGHNVTGYTWASAADIIALYKSYGAQSVNSCRGAVTCLTGAAWYSRVMADFQPTNPKNKRKHPVIKAFTDCSGRNENISTCQLIFMHIGNVRELPERIVSKPLDYVSSHRSAEQGVFLYRPYTPPGTQVYSEKRSSSVTPDGRTGTNSPYPSSAPVSR